MPEGWGLAAGLVAAWAIGAARTLASRTPPITSAANFFMMFLCFLVVYFDSNDGQQSSGCQAVIHKLQPLAGAEKADGGVDDDTDEARDNPKAILIVVEGHRHVHAPQATDDGGSRQENGDRGEAFEGAV